jgi:membrane peptidoglycan carboxypeptidase
VVACAAATKAGVAPAVTLAPAQQVLNPQHVYLMTSILGDLEARRPMFGANAALLSLPDRPAAAKTGTSNDYRDAWTLGYTPDLAVGVWLGNADYKPMQKVAGSIGAAPIWQNTMKRALQGRPVQPFVVPAGIQHLRVCADSGTEPGAACPAIREEIFAANQGPLPAKYDLYQRVRVDKLTGRPATEFTPADRIEERVLMIFPARYRAWAEAHGYPQLAEPPTYAFKPELILYSPLNGSNVRGVVQVAGRVHLPPPLVWRVEYGVGPGPIGWGVIAGSLQGDIDGIITGWDAAQPVEQHGASDFSVRLAAYDPTFLDYPVAVSNVAYVRVVNPTATATVSPLPTASPSPSPSASASVSPTRTKGGPPPTTTATPSGTPSSTNVPAASRTPTAAATAPPAATATRTRAATATLSPAATPTAPATATATRPAGAPASPTGTAPAATHTPAPAGLVAVITEPAERATVSGQVRIAGTAAGPVFASYFLEYAPGEDPAIVPLWYPADTPKTRPVTIGPLGIWQTATLSPGPYLLLLTVAGADGTQATAVVRVEVAAP